MKVLAGDFTKGPAVKISRGLMGGFKKLKLRRGLFRSSSYRACDITSLELVDGHNQTSILGKVVWGAAGLALLGGIGMLAGILGGGNRTRRLVVLGFKDDRSVMLECSAKEYTILAAAANCMQPAA